ncbi:MAG: CinA family protein [Campylobacterota bacterium]
MTLNNSFTNDEMITLQNLLRCKCKTITTAESCTGGLVANKLTQLAGSSEIFKGSIVSYSNEIKCSQLGVKKDTLNKYGAVSTQTVDEMLQGVVKKMNSNYAIAISGIAGPQGGSTNKPVGTIVIGICDDKDYKDIEVFHFKGNRMEIQEQAASSSLRKILQFLQKSLDK